MVEANGAYTHGRYEKFGYILCITSNVKVSATQDR